MRLNLKTAAEPAASLPDPATAILRLDRVSARYGAVAALDEVSLAVGDGEILCLLGPSGSGKSTLLRLVAGVDAPAAGRIMLDGVEVAGPGRFVEPEARRVGMVFQDFALFPHLTVEANVAFGLRGRPRAEVRAVVEGLLDRLGLAHYARSYPHMLSGGERQRVALARAMAPGPRLLMMDEPFSSLDSRLREEVRRYTIDFLRETGTTTLIVTHDPEEAMSLGDRIALLERGRLLQCGTPDELYARPCSESAARLLGEVNVIPGVCRHGAIETPLGVFPAPQLPDGTAVRVCIRPEHVRVAAHPAAAAARVVGAAFLGEVDRLQLAVSGLDAPVTARAFGRTRLRPGDRVSLEVPPGCAIILTTDGSRRPVIN
jgi:iron(III) transport system ATP-binding protein